MWRLPLAFCSYVPESCIFKLEVVMMKGVNVQVKITNARITNFKKISNLEFRPGQVNVILGPNGTGKSSILQALRYGLTGNSPQDPIGCKADRAIVEMSFPDIGVLKRTLGFSKNEVRLNGKVTTQKSINDLFYRQTGATAETASLLTSAEVVSNLSSGDLSSYFMDNNLLNVAVNFDLLLSFCKLTEEGKAELQKHFGDQPFQMGDIDRVWNEAKARRKVLKQEVKEAEIRSKGNGNQIEESAEEIEIQLRELMKKQAELQAAKNNYEQVCQQRNKALHEIERIQKKIGVVLSPPDTSEFDKIDSEIGSLEEELTNLKGFLATVYETGVRVSNIIKELETPTCPISPKLICTTDKSPIRSELNDALLKARAEYSNQRNRITLLERKRNDLKQKRKVLESQITEFQNQEILRKQMEYLKGNLPEEPPKPSEEIKEVTKRVELINNKRALIIQNLIAAEYSDLYRKKSKELAVYEEIVRELDPKNGIRQKVLEHSLKPLEEYFNNELVHLLPGYRVRLDCSNGFYIHISNGEREFDASKSASSGEKSRIWFILMDLINALTPYRILIYDNTDSMDSPSLSRLLNMLNSEEVRNRYDHIFLSMIDYDEVADKLEKMPEITVIRTGWSKQNKSAA